MSRFQFLFVILLSGFLYTNISGYEIESSGSRIIYYIHGDGSYLFHNENGKEILADKRILKQALSVAKASINSEVFILHHKPEKRFLFLFDLNNADFYYYKNGSLVTRKSYKTNKISGFRRELELIQTYSPVNSDNIRNYFLFYGHRIPEDEGIGYNVSQPDNPLNIKMIKDGLASYIKRNKFELIVLSTCKNGTPVTINAFSELSKYIVASPEDLPLYYISSLPFKIFSKNANINTSRFVHILAKYSFERLSSKIFTMITISIYNTMQLNNSDLDDWSCSKGVPSSEGVTIFYKPPRFGELKNKMSHSGWGCFEENSKTDSITNLY